MSTPILEIRNLTKRFPAVLAVDRASIAIEAGKVHSIVGGNGAGKSTLVKILAGVYPHGDYEGGFPPGRQRLPLRQYHRRRGRRHLHGPPGPEHG